MNAEEAELHAAAIGHGIWEILDTMRSQAKLSALQWGAYGGHLEELERVHYALLLLNSVLVDIGDKVNGGDAD
jgi:hypothetical protein